MYTRPALLSPRRRLGTGGYITKPIPNPLIPDSTPAQLGERTQSIEPGSMLQNLYPGKYPIQHGLASQSYGDVNEDEAPSLSLCVATHQSRVFFACSSHSSPSSPCYSPRSPLSLSCVSAEVFSCSFSRVSLRFLFCFCNFLVGLGHLLFFPQLFCVFVCFDFWKPSWTQCWCPSV